MDTAQRPYFLLSFLPALAYWYLETYHDLETALIGGVILGVLEILIEKKFSGHVHTLSKLNLSLIVVLGGLALLAKEGLFFKLQPTFTGIAVGGYLIFKKLRHESLLLEMLRDLKQTPPLPEAFYLRLEWHLCLFLLAFAAFMAWVAVQRTTAAWLFWKTGGFYLAFGGFLVAELFFLRWTIRRPS